MPDSRPPTRQRALLAVAAFALLVVVAAGDAAAPPAATSEAQHVTVATEAQLRAALAGGHTSSGRALHVTIQPRGGSLQLTRGITIPPGAGPITLAAPEGAAGRVTLDARGVRPSAPAITAGPDVALQLRGLHITGANFTGSTDTPGGGAVACVACRQLSVADSRFTSNRAPKGGAVFASSVAGGVRISNTSFERNACGAGDGGAVWVGHTALRLVASSFVDNKAPCPGCWGGGVNAFNLTAAVVEDTRFERCQASENGGAMASTGVASSAFTRVSCTSCSTATLSGGALVFLESSANISDSRFFNGSAAGSGAALQIERSSKIRAVNTTFKANKASYGGAIYLQDHDSSLMLEACRVLNNSASATGGGVATEGSSPWLAAVDTEFSGNQGGIGGAVACVGTNCSFTNCSVANNSASNTGGGIWASSSASLAITVSRISHNQAKRGGGLFAEAAGSFVVEASAITHNTASIDGGGVLLVLVGNASISQDSHIDSNTAQVGGGLALLSTRSFSLANSTLAGNSAERTERARLTVATMDGSLARAGSGGGVFAARSHLDLIGATIEDCAASQDGGGMFLASSSASLLGCMLRHNKAAGDGGGLHLDLATNLSATANGTCFASNTAAAGSGGAAFVTGGDGSSFACWACSTEHNTALGRVSSRAGAGGGFAVSGALAARFSSLQARNNTAGGPGGAIACRDGTSLVLEDSSVSSNTAGWGGAASCMQCRHANITRLAANDNAAASGAALHLDLVAVGSADNGGVFDSSFRGNSALEGNASQLAALGQAQASTLGAGGAVLVAHARPFAVHRCSFASNRGSGDGGAVYQHAACPSGSSCALSLASCSFAGNAAASGSGGAVFTTNARQLQLGSNLDAPSCNKPDAAAMSPEAACNEAAFAGAIAGTPARLGLRSTDSAAVLASGSSRGSMLPAVLLESNNQFSLAVLLLDDFGAPVRARGDAEAVVQLVSTSDGNNTAAVGPLCARYCGDEAGAPCVLGCLTGATAVKFDASGVASFTLGLSAPPNSTMAVRITPRGLVGVPALDVVVRVQPCGVGERVANGTCEACPTPLTSLSPYDAGASCVRCPSGADCSSGLPIPLPGFWHSHPRSLNFHACPVRTACSPPSPAPLLAYQRAHKHDAADSTWGQFEDSHVYSRLQCADGAAGPLCSACAPGFGRALGGVCRRCIGSSVGAWLAFAAVRVLDVLLVTALVQLLLLVQRLTEQGAGKMAARLGDCVLACVEWHQLAYALLLAASPLLPAAASAVAALLLLGTPQNTLRWVPLECMLPPGTAAAAQVALSAAYPAFLAASTLGVLLAIDRLLACRASRPSMRAASLTAPLIVEHSGSGAAASIVEQPSDASTAEATASSASNGMPSPYMLAATQAAAARQGGLQEQQESTLDALQSGARRLGALALLVLAAAASLLWCATDLAAAVAGAWHCVPLDADGPLLAGEQRAARGLRWSQDLSVACGARAHVAAAVVAGVLVLPLLLCALLAACCMGASLGSGHLAVGQLRQRWWAGQGGAAPRKLALGAEAASSALVSVPYTHAWWLPASLAWRVLLVVALALLGSSVASAALLQGLCASACIALLQLAHAWSLPAACAASNRLMAACYLALQVIACLTVVAAQATGPAAQALAASIAVVAGGACVFLACRVLASIARGAGAGGVAAQESSGLLQGLLLGLGSSAGSTGSKASTAAGGSRGAGAVVTQPSIS